MNHGGDHGGHGGHDMPGMPAGPTCSMNMLWNTQIADTCIVFRSWHISSTTAFVFSCAVVVGLGVLYEWLRAAQRTLDRRIAATLSAQGKGKAAAASTSRGEGSVSGRNSPEWESEEAGLLTGSLVTKARAGTALPVSARISRAVLYGASVFLSFFLMLVFMTYNAYLILATVVGAALGNFIFSTHMDIDAVLAGGADGKGMACH
ncbi:Ctr-domain-containing protein [Trametes versicolor FP-101664 SS1]|uniref:Ctr-domain-containing protein n=1 Tax=Trametes versicolor (strain FP-101664) TaxID=717944 RepID=UPI00046216FA|nr:Ctr-domain-containing protein [Trametes versicolor FP-101664 SS1]EIW62651.1 Ctr-domain-containing protein [Trametes versicolor FP-101664 SS1]